jgi:hypothetical protein
LHAAPVKSKLASAGRCLRALLGCLALSLICAGSALGARAHEFTTTFGEGCIAEPCEGAALKAPQGIAVNEATGDVYVVDKGEGEVGGRVVRFSSAGVFQSEFDGSGSRPEEGEAAPSGLFDEPETIAVDNSCALRKLTETELTLEACEAQDPSNGDVYVVAAPAEGHGVIDKYSPSGKYISQITEAGGVALSNRPLTGIAVDPKGTVWVYRAEAGAVIDEFDNKTPNAFLAPELALNALGGFAQPGFAVDSEDNFYGRLFVGSLPQIAKWDSTGHILIESLDGEGSSAVAVEQTSNASFVDSATRIDAFAPDGTPLESLGEEGGVKHLQEGAGIGVNAATGSLYVSDPATGPVVEFGPAAPSAPKVEGESFSEVGADNAGIAAQINPRSEAGEAPTEYHFQYGRCASATSCASSGYEASTPSEELPPDFEVHSVSAELEGLQPNTTYHFRAIAKNAHGEGEPGTEVSFTTQGAGGTVELADNRGWELVSPPDKQGSLIEPIFEVGVVQAAANGGAITYLANAPTEAEPQGNANTVQVLSSRGGASWSSRDIAIPHESPTGGPFGEGPEFKFFDAELSLSAVQPFGPFNPALSAEASEATAYLHSLDLACGSSCYRPLVTGKVPFANVPAGTEFGEGDLCEPAAGRDALNACGPRFLGATEDLSHLVLKANAALASGGAALGGLYEWSGGTLSPVSVLPGGQAVGEGQLGRRSQATRGAISSDGNRIAWEAKGKLYQRDMAREETVQLDAAVAPAGEGAPEKEEREARSGSGQFQLASADGSRVLFTDTQPLTADSGAEAGVTNPKADLYECKVAVNGAGKLICELSDLTPQHSGESANVQGSVLGASQDAMSVYFVAKGVLSEAANARGEKAQPGQANLYEHEGAGTRFIATLDGEDEHDWGFVGGEPASPRDQPTRASSNGRFLELMSQASPTGYDNRDAATGKPVAEVYLYDAATNRLSCASCEPSGVRPVGVEYRKLEPGNGGLVGGPRDTWPASALVAANVPGWTATTEGTPQSRYQPRYLSNSGRLFFNTADALAPQDANGTQDVYEYEPPGVGDCSEALTTYSARSGGCVSLISSGASSQESAFLDASESGDDVFFLTSARLSAIDVDAARDVYDAHVCTSSEPCIAFAAPQPPPCTTEASCKASPTPQPSIFGAPASATFSGNGNLPAPLPSPPTPKTPEQIRAEKLAKALRACKAKKNKHKRQACEKTARKKYGPKTKAKAKAKKSKKAKSKRKAGR